MLSAVLKSDIAIEVSIEIMRTFTKIREFSLHYNTLSKYIIELERKYDKTFRDIFSELESIMENTQETDRKVMGFIRE